MFKTFKKVSKNFCIQPKEHQIKILQYSNGVKKNILQVTKCRLISLMGLESYSAHWYEKLLNRKDKHAHILICDFP